MTDVGPSGHPRSGAAFGPSDTEDALDGTPRGGHGHGGQDIAAEPDVAGGRVTGRGAHVGGVDAQVGIVGGTEEHGDPLAECATSAAGIPEECALDLSFSETTDGRPDTGAPAAQWLRHSVPHSSRDHLTVSG